MLDTNDNKSGAGCRDFTVRLAKEVITLMFVGTDTTGYIISRSMVWLSKNPEWLTALNDEQDRLVAEYGAELSREVCAFSSQVFF
jgi:cytochrome P450